MHHDVEGPRGIRSHLRHHTGQLGEWLDGQFVTWAESLADGGHTAMSESDARKSAYTNAFKKAAAFFGCARQAYEGSIDLDNVPTEVPDFTPTCPGWRLWSDLTVALRLLLRAVHVPAPSKPSGPARGLLADVVRTRSELLVENAFLRQQLLVASRAVRKPRLRASDREPRSGRPSCPRSRDRWESLRTPLGTSLL